MKPFDALRLYRDYGVKIAPAEHKHFQQGWINTICPFCKGNPGYHLGYNLSNGYFRCWRCGWKPPTLALSGLLGKPETQIRSLVLQYPALKTNFLRSNLNDLNLTYGLPNPLKFPPGSTTFLPAHLQYIESREFDPDYLTKVWDVSGIGPVSWPGWNWRILIPIYFNGHLVSYQTRSLSDNREDKYRACPKELEIIQHKHVLYGLDKCVDFSTAVVTEGVTKVWRLGIGSLATFGTQVKPLQRILLRRFKRLFIIFDSDKHGAGQLAGEKLAWQLSGFGIEVKQIILDVEDPTDLSQDEANYLMTSLGIMGR